VSPLVRDVLGKRLVVDPPPHVVCLGDVMVDVVAHLPGPLAVGSDTPAPISLYGGGSAANTASWLELLGVPTTLIAKVGDDVFGTWSTEQFAWLSKDLAVDPALTTGTCLVLVGPDGERTMVPDTGANTALAPEDVEPEDFTPGRYLHVSGYSLFNDARPAALHALALARHAGMTISVGAASAGPLESAGADAFLDWVGSDLLLFANRDEARVLTGLSNPRAAATALAARVGRVAVTVGVRGSLWCDGGLVDDLAAVAVEPVDTTGAGDAYAAAMLWALGQGAAPPAALQLANAFGRDACLHRGGRPSPLQPLL
jgi:sugar/nucleoside kinase (ribokinase family)